MSNGEIEFLVKLGIPEKSAQIYTALLDLWDAGITDIAERANLHRPDVYRFLPILLEKKLITEIRKGKRSLYRVGDVESLRILREDFVSNSEVMLKRLETRHQAKSLKARLTHLKGIESISGLYVDALRLTPSGENYLRYSSGRDIYDRSKYSSPEYQRLKENKGVGRLVIANSVFGKRRFANDPSREVRVVPEEYGRFEDNISKLIYADRVAIVDHDTLEAFVIESERFAEYERKIFGYLWKLLGR